MAGQSDAEEKDIKRRSEAAKRALGIVRKFPQIEQEVLAPMMAREIGIALLNQQERTAERCAEIVIARFYQRFLPDTDIDIAWNQCLNRIRAEFGLERRPSGFRPTLSVERGDSGLSSVNEKVGKHGEN